MKFIIISIFPEIFESFLNCSLVGKAIEGNKIKLSTLNPRSFCTDKNKQVDDEIYGGGHGLLLKAQPIIDCINSINEKDDKKTLFIEVGPSETIFEQTRAHQISEEYSTVIFLCGRYEGIDYRVRQRGKKKFGDRYQVLSLGEFITLGGEIPSLTMIEAITRLLPGVIGNTLSWEYESYNIEKNTKNLEHPQFTRPQIVEGLEVPEVLLSGNHAKIQNRKSDNERSF